MVRETTRIRYDKSTPPLGSGMGQGVVVGIVSIGNDCRRLVISQRTPPLRVPFLRSGNKYHPITSRYQSLFVEPLCLPDQHGLRPAGPHRPVDHGVPELHDPGQIQFAPQVPSEKMNTMWRRRRIHHIHLLFRRNCFDLAGNTPTPACIDVQERNMPRREKIVWQGTPGASNTSSKILPE